MTSHSEHTASRPGSSEDEGILSLSALSFHYNGDKQPVLQNLSLQFPARAITAILGPNGSGKTTLLRLLLGALQPHQGQILVAGRPQGDYPRRELSQLLGLVPQDEHIPFDFTVLEYVLLGRAPYLGPLAAPGEVDAQIARAALQKCGLQHLPDRPLPTLSGGERQLATVARALAQKPSILLLDEPTAHLDLGNKGRLLKIMRELLAAGVTLILTTHDPNLASAVASHAVLMHQGQILDAGPVRDMLTAEKLSATYGVPVKVVDIEARQVVLLL